MPRRGFSCSGVSGLVARLAAAVWQLGAASSGWADEPKSKWPYEVTAGLFPRPRRLRTLDQPGIARRARSPSAATSRSCSSCNCPPRRCTSCCSADMKSIAVTWRGTIRLCRTSGAVSSEQRGTSMLLRIAMAELATDLRHEATHALLNEGSSPLPLWLDEGLRNILKFPDALRLVGARQPAGHSRTWRQVGLARISGRSGVVSRRGRA